MILMYLKSCLKVEEENKMFDNISGVIIRIIAIAGYVGFIFDFVSFETLVAGIVFLSFFELLNISDKLK